MESAKSLKQLQLFFEGGKKFPFKRKVTILHTEMEEEAIYYWIASGYVKVCSYNKAGNETIHYIYGPNDIIPIGWQFNKPYQGTSFIALSDLTVYGRSEQEFYNFTKKSGFLLSEISYLLLQMHDRIYNLNLDSAHVRIAHSLVTFATRYGEKDGSNYFIDMILTQQEFADLIRASRETTNKILNDFEDKKYIIHSKKQIVVNVDKLIKVLKT